MKKKPDGGSAFPTCIWQGDFHAGHFPGMSLRDYFAGQALISIVRSRGNPFFEKDDATWSYRVADAMLKERDKADGKETS